MPDTMQPVSPKVVRRRNLRSVVRGAYDLQELRKSTGLRIYSNVRSRLGIEPGTVEDPDEDKEATKFLDQLKASYVLMTEGVARNRELPDIKKFKGDELISDYAELVLAHSFFSMKRNEDNMFNSIGKLLDEWPIYTDFLKHVRGMGFAMSGVILSELDITKARYPSSFEKYAGIDVVLDVDGKGRTKREEHLVKRAYIDKKGEPKERNSITYNPFLKTKLMGVTTTNFLRGASQYKEVYDNYKNRYQNRPDIKFYLDGGVNDEGKAIFTKLRVHRMSLRSMMAIFLNDLYIEWCHVEGLPIPVPYEEAKLGMFHSEMRIHNRIRQARGAPLINNGK